jgi:hypothetical protein
MIFVGEHTSYTHAWIASALESGIRGSVQLMLGKKHSRQPGPLNRDTWAHQEGLLTIAAELGLVDEAKTTVEKWMARWIDVVSWQISGPSPKLCRKKC